MSFVFVCLFVFNISDSDYISAFASRPKIPHTPDGTDRQNGSHRDRGLILAPQFSQSEPQQSSRPGSASSTGGGGSGGKHLLMVEDQQLPPVSGGKVWLQWVI